MLCITLFLVFLHALVIYKYYGIFSKPTRFYWPLFIRNFHVSGFDPITYSVVSDWSAGYNVYRHPLLAFFMYPAYLVNQGLMWLTGKNCALFVVAAMQTFWGSYAMLFFYRIVREILSLDRAISTMLTLFFMSFGCVMLTCMTPDHFVISMCLLLIALYVSGKRMLSGRPFTTWQTILYFVLTAGVSLNNGLKIFIANFFVNKRRFFRPVNLIFGIALPALIMWGFCRWEYQKLVYPTEHKRHIVNKKRKEQQEKKAYEMRLAEARQDSILRANGDTATLFARESARKVEAHKKEEAKKKQAAKQGAPISKGEFLRWTDITSSRLDAIVENLFGESIQLHQKHLLGDVMRNRPMIVRYNHWWNYAVEAIIALLFLLGIWYGRRSQFLWLVLSFFGMDMALHIGLGFGINEVYIMSGHWIYAIPIAIAFCAKRWRQTMMLILPVTVYLFVYNVTLLLKYFV